MVATLAPTPSPHLSGLHALCRRAGAGVHPDTAAACSCLQSGRPWMLTLLLLGIAVLALAVDAATLTPGATVYRAWPSGACRAVVSNEATPIGCANLPRLHRVVWVSPDWNGDPAALVESTRPAADDTGRT